MASRRRVPWIAPGDGADHITALPLELRARIASLLPFLEVAGLANLSRPWRHIHHHTPVVELDLDNFIVQREGMLVEDDPGAVVLDEDALACLEVALARRRAQEGSGSKVDTLRVRYCVEDPRMRRHAGLVIALADAREICLTLTTPRASDDHAPLDAWTVDLSPAARDMEVASMLWIVAPTVAGPGAAALQTLQLNTVTLRECPCLPSLRSLTLDDVTVEASFQPGAWCPRLERLCIFRSSFKEARVDIRLPLLNSLEMDADVDVDVVEGRDYKSFTLRAPRLRCLLWSEQFAERVDIDVGNPSSVTSGRIKFTWSRDFEGCHEMKEFRAQTMRILEGLLPELPPERVAEAARPYMSLDVDKVTVEDPYTSEPIPAEKLTCDLSGLMSSLKARSPVPF